MRVRKGKRRTVVVEHGRWRFRATLGRFRWGREHVKGQFGLDGFRGTVSTPVLLVTYLRLASERCLAARRG